MAWKLALPAKLVALNTLMAAAFLFPFLELVRSDTGRIVLVFFLFPALLIAAIDLVFMLLHLIWSAIFGRTKHT